MGYPKYFQRISLTCSPSDHELEDTWGSSGQESESELDLRT
jgi:hypothetical protein